MLDGVHMAKKGEDKKTSKLEWGLSTVAALLMLFTASIDTRLTIALAVVYLFAISFVMKDKFWKQLPFALASIMVAGVVAVTMNAAGGGSVDGLIISGIVGIAIIAFVLYRRKNRPVISDERVVAISNRSMAYSWWLTYLMIAILFWFDYTGYLKLTVFQFGGALLFTMLISHAIISRYLLSRGDA